MNISIDLPRLLDTPSSESDVKDSVRWLIRVFEWIFEAGDPKAQAQRFQLLVGVWEANSERAGRMRAALAAILREADVVSLFVRTGIPNEPTLMTETQERILRFFLSHPHPTQDLAEVFRQVFNRKSRREWLEYVPMETFARLLSLLGDHADSDELKWRTRDMIHHSIQFLSAEVRALSQAKEFNRPGDVVSLPSSPYMELDLSCQRLARLNELNSEFLAYTQKLIERAQNTLNRARNSFQKKAPRAHTSYQMERLTASLARLRILVECLPSTLRQSAPRDAIRWTILFRTLVDGAIGDWSWMDLARRTLRAPLLGILEHSNRIGDHYIAKLPREHRKVFWAAVGGGVITGGTVFLKFSLHHYDLSLFALGMLYSINYAASFLLMQLMGYTLASKKPAMTGVALGFSIPRTGAVTFEAIGEFFKKAKHAFKTQIYAVAGNVLAVIPSSMLAGGLYRICTSRDFISATDAEHILHSFHPTQSLTILYASITGVCLWLSSLAAGYIESWLVHRRLHERRAHDPEFPRRMGAAGVNVSLGVLLGFVPILGKFLGIPFEVHHITLASGSVGLAIERLGFAQAIHAGLFATVIGLACIATMNFGVSFAIAWYVSRRARGAKTPGMVELAKAGLKDVLSTPQSATLRRSYEVAKSTT